MYIRQSKLPNLKAYKYSGVDDSLVSRYILKPFYTNVVIKCFPLWMAWAPSTLWCSIAADCRLICSPNLVRINDHNSSALYKTTLELISQPNTDYFDWVFFRGHKLSYASVVLSDPGPRLPSLGLFIVCSSLFPPHFWSKVLTAVTE